MTLAVCRLSQAHVGWLAKALPSPYRYLSTNLAVTLPLTPTNLGATLVSIYRGNVRVTADLAVTLLLMPANLGATLVSLPATLGVTLGLICRGNVRVTADLAVTLLFMPANLRARVG